jgi:hypothetical protein
MAVRETSREALKTIRDNGLLSERRLQVYELLFLHGPCTGAELFEAFNIAHGRKNSSNSNILTRLGELRDCGCAKEVRTRKCTMTGQTVIEWDVTKALPRDVKKPKKTNCPHCRGKGYIIQERLL